MKTRAVRFLAWLAVLGVLGGCAVTGYPSQERQGSGMPSPPGVVSYGVVSGIDRVNASPSSVGRGALIGGAVGAIVGRELGEKAMGKAAATMVGAAAGAMIGNEIERQQAGGSRERVRVSVQFDDGGTRGFEQESAGDLRVGDRVRVENNRLQRL